MSRYISAAHTKAEMPAAIVPSLTSMLAGSNQRAVEHAPANPATPVKNDCIAGA